MAKTFGQYTGGIQAIQGINEFGAQQAAGIERTGANIANLITQGFKDYNENKNKREITAAKGAGVYENIKFLQENIKDNPELAPFADRFKPIMDKFGKFDSMSTNQQTAFLLEAEAFQQGVVPNLSIYEKGLVARTKQGVQNALSKEVKIPDNQGGYVTGTPFSTASTIEENLALARKSFEVQAKVGNLKSFDIESALSKLTTQWENSFANDPNMAKNDPALRDAILKNISDYRNLSSNVATDETTGVTDYAQEAESYAGASTSAAKALESKDMAEMLAAQKKTGVTSATGTAPVIKTGKQKFEEAGKPLVEEKTKALNAYNAVSKEYESLISQFQKDITTGNWSTPEGKERQKRLNAMPNIIETAREMLDERSQAVSSHQLKKDDFKDDVAPPAPARTISNIQRLAERKVGEIKPKVEEEAKLAALGKTLVEETQAKLNSIIEADGDTTITELLQNINREENKRNPTLKDIPMMAGDDFGFGGKGVETYTDASANLKKAASSLGIPLKEKLTADQMFKVLQELEKQKVVAGTKATATAKTLEELAPETVGLGVEAATAPVVNKYAKVFNYNAQIQEGVVEGFRAETFAEERERVRQWFVTNNKGIIPSSLEEVYATIRPESRVRFMDAPNGKVMITAQGAQYIPNPKVTAMSDKEKSEVTLYNWGTKTATGEYIPIERTKGSGIKLAGFALGGEENAKAFQQLHNDTVKIRTIVPQLIAMYKTDKLGRTLIPNENWGVAKSLLAQLKAAIRVETVGTGPVAIAEHAAIEKRVADPTAFLSLDIVGKGTLEGLLKSNEMALVNNNAGIQVTFDQPKEAKANSIQQARIAETIRKK